MDRGGRSEGTGRGGDVEEFGQIRRVKVMEGVELNRRILKSMQSLTGSQWSCCITGVMW